MYPRESRLRKTSSSSKLVRSVSKIFESKPIHKVTPATINRKYKTVTLNEIWLPFCIVEDAAFIVDNPREWQVGETVSVTAERIGHFYLLTKV